MSAEPKREELRYGRLGGGQLRRAEEVLARAVEE
jgi:hypothetical protein